MERTCSITRVSPLQTATRSRRDQAGHLLPEGQTQDLRTESVSSQQDKTEMEQLVLFVIRPFLSLIENQPKRPDGHIID